MEGSGRSLNKEQVAMQSFQPRLRWFTAVTSHSSISVHFTNDSLQATNHNVICSGQNANSRSRTLASVNAVVSPTGNLSTSAAQTDGGRAGDKRGSETAQRRPASPSLVSLVARRWSHGGGEVGGANRRWRKGEEEVRETRRKRRT